VSSSATLGHKITDKRTLRVYSLVNRRSQPRCSQRKCFERFLWPLFDSLDKSESLVRQQFPDTLLVCSVSHTSCPVSKIVWEEQEEFAAVLHKISVKGSRLEIYYYTIIESSFTLIIPTCIDRIYPQQPISE
jgi:hypothetical protein